jgi:hypothetical protein
MDKDIGHKARMDAMGKMMKLELLKSSLSSLLGKGAKAGKGKNGELSGFNGRTRSR